MNVTEDPMIIDFSIIIDKTFKMKAYKRSTVVNLRHLIDAFNWRLTLFSQVNSIISYLDTFPIDFQNDISHIGKYFGALIDDSEDIGEGKKKKLNFLSSQMCLHGYEVRGHRFDVTAVRDALGIFLRSRNVYKALREYLILPCGKTLKSYFGKLGTAGSSEECKCVIANVFSKLTDMEKLCYITADEIYVKVSVRYRAGNIIGLSVNQDPPKPAKTILGLMVNFLYGTPGFIARLLP